MKIHAFQAPDELAHSLESAREGSVVSIYDEALVRQWSSVLRFEAGERVLLYFGGEFEAECVVETLSRKEISVAVARIGRNFAAAALAQWPIRAYVASLKGDSFEWAAQKLAEIGVSDLVPVIADRCQKRSVNISRIQAIAREASEQSMNARIMKVHEPVSFEDAVSDAISLCDGGFIAAHVDSLSKDGTAAADAVSSVSATQKQEQKQFDKYFSAVSGTVRGFIVGPEGGFTDSEVEVMRAARVRFMSLGPTVLRAETAAISCALAVRDSARGC